MSSFLRQEEHALFYSQAVLGHWESLGARVHWTISSELKRREREAEQVRARGPLRRWLVASAVVGSLGAMILVRLLTRLPTVSGLIDGRIEPLFVGYGLLIALVVGLLGGLLPAFRASRMLPSSALRYE